MRSAVPPLEPRDFTASSPDGALRLEVESGRRTRVALRRGDALVWEIPDLAGGVAGAHVSSEGWVVALTLGSELVPIDPRGVAGAAFPLLRPGRVDRYLPDPTTLRRWDRGATWTFREHLARPHFVLRTWWGRHVILRLDDGRAVEVDDALAEASLGRARFLVERAAAADDPLARELCRSEHAILETLEDDGGIGEGNGDEWERRMNLVWEAQREAEELLDASFVASDLGLTEAIPWLRGLAMDDSHVVYARADGLRATIYPLRQLARDALRRFGQRPPPEATLILEALPGGAVVPPPPPANQRAGAGPYRSGGASEGPEPPKRGATMAEVLARLGSPERFRFMTRDAFDVVVWEYDVDAPPSTLAITWRKAWLARQPTVDVAELGPPAWERPQPDEELLRAMASEVVATGLARLDGETGDLAEDVLVVG